MSAAPPPPPPPPRPAPAPVQAPLFPERPLSLGNLELLPLDRFPADALLEGPPPSAALVESIRRWGVLEPVLVRAVGGSVDYANPRTLVSGRRRLKAVRLLQAEYREAVRRLAATVPPETLLNDETVPGYRAVYERLAACQRIPCRVVSDPEGTLQDGRTEVLALTTNAVRADNPTTDFRNLSFLVARFVGQGLSEREALAETAKATGLASGTVKQRLRLLDLSLELQDDFMAGRLGYGVALEASRLGAESQALFAAMLDGGQAPTLALVKQAKREAVQAHQASLLDALPDLPAPAAGAGGAWPESGDGDGLLARAADLARRLADIQMPITQEAASVIEALLDAVKERSDG